jgi:SAM-dependent methyltransferase
MKRIRTGLQRPASIGRRVRAVVRRARKLVSRTRPYRSSLLRGHWNVGRCPICEGPTVFVELGDYLRDHYRCIRCGSIPRYRATIYFLSRLFPNWRALSIYEAAPSGPASTKLRRECGRYVSSQFFPGVRPGTLQGGVRVENLECLTFPDESFDIVISQDVLEHLMRPQLVFAEIARVLRPGGAHLFTVPCDRSRTTLVRAIPDENGSIQHLLPPDYHGDPVAAGGSLVVTEWGDDLLAFIEDKSKMPTTVYRLCNRRLGLDGEFLEVFVSWKSTSDSTTPRGQEAAR